VDMEHGAIDMADLPNILRGFFGKLCAHCSHSVCPTKLRCTRA
jgi:hypothetical protein